MVEWGDSDSVTQTPKHPYTQLLIQSVPEVGRKSRQGAKKSPSGQIPIWTPESVGCPFVARCLKASDLCKQSMPEVTQVATDHFIRCHHAD